MTAIGFVVKQKSRKDLGSESVFTFSHKTILEYLATQYVCKSGEDVCKLLLKVKECTDENRRESSLFLQFVFGHLKGSPKIETVFKKFVPRSFWSLYGLECVAECGFFKSLDKFWSEYIPAKVTLYMSSNPLYSQLGLDIMTSECETYKLETLTIIYNNTDARGKMTILYKLLAKAEHSVLDINGKCDVRDLVKYKPEDNEA